MTSGILAVWNNCAAGHVAAYERWYQGEHLPERLSVPGFRRGRRYGTMAGPPDYFTYYDVDAPSVLQSTGYLNRVNDPTPQTRQIMDGIFLDMSRTVCSVVSRRGDLRGAFAITCQVPPGRLDEALASLTLSPAIARIEGWLAADLDARAPSTEERLRGADQAIEACLFVETLREAPARALARQLAPFGETGLYALLCELTEEG